MSLGFYCVSNAQGYILTIPSLRDIWGQSCTWQGSPGPHSTRVIPADSMRNPELVHLLTTERLVLDPKSHALQFREDVNVLKAQYVKELEGLYMPPAAVTVPVAVAPTADEIAATNAAAVAEAEALIAAEEAAAVSTETVALSPELPVAPPVEAPVVSSTSSSKKKHR